MTWFSLAIHDGPIQGPEGPRFIQCHARMKYTWRFNGERFRCRNWKRRDHIGQCPPDEWLCHAHEGTEVAFDDQDPCRCRDTLVNRLSGYRFHNYKTCPFYGTRTRLENHGKA